MSNKSKLINKIIFHYIIPLCLSFAFIRDADFTSMQKIAFGVICLTAFQARYPMRDLDER